MKKIKILLLGRTDINLAGHTGAIFSHYQKMEDVECCMVTHLGLYENSSSCLIKKNASFFRKIWEFRYTGRFVMLWRYCVCLFRYGIFPVIDKNHLEYCFYGTEFVPFTAKDILRKVPAGFVPDIIKVIWGSGFVTSKILYDLHKLTGAKILYSFIDEAPMTGGCHYPNECNQYLSGCNNCPALLRGKKIAAVQIKRKEKYLKDVPLYFESSPYDYRLAKKTILFRNATGRASIPFPKVTITPQKKARELLGIDTDDFLVMVGADKLSNVRKGFKYAIGALTRFCCENEKVRVLCVGESGNVLKMQLPNIKVYDLGYVDIVRLYTAFSAADVFLSTTIADSGPMMVIYSIAIGTPVVSFSIGYAEDLVVHKVTGCIAEYKNEKELADGLAFVQTLSDDEKKKMAEACKSHIREKYKESGSYIDFLKEISQ